MTLGFCMRDIISGSVIISDIISFGSMPWSLSWSIICTRRATFQDIICHGHTPVHQRWPHSSRM